MKSAHRRLATAAGAALTCALIAVPTGCGGVNPDVDATTGTLRPIRGNATVDGDGSPRLARVGAGQTIGVGDRGLARLQLDEGPRLLLDAGAALEMGSDGRVSLETGRVFAEAPAGAPLAIETAHGPLRVSDAAVSAHVKNKKVSVYVVRGRLAYGHDDTTKTVRGGERLVLGAGEPKTEPAVLWDDWTAGQARAGPTTKGTPRGLGMLQGRVPDETGRARWPLAMRRVDVNVRIRGNLAITEVDQRFFNPASETVEGVYRIRVPESAVLQRFAVDRNGDLVDGYIKERAQAREEYEEKVYKGSSHDPALLEWEAPGRYRARIYPIDAGATRRIVIRYAQWLRRPEPGAPRLYRYPMGPGEGRRGPHVQELSFEADLSEAGAASVRAGLGAHVEENKVKLRRSDFRPRADLWLELIDEEAPEAQQAWRSEHEPPERAPGASVTAREKDQRDYWYLPLVLPERLAEERKGKKGLDLVVVADVSAATDDAHLELGRSVVESIAMHLGEDDRVAIVTSDLAIRGLGEDGSPELGPASPERIDRLLDALARAPSGGATDLGTALGQAAKLLDPNRRGAVVYVGDGAPTVGELEADALRERMQQLAHPVRLYGVTVGTDSHLDLLASLVGGAGLARRVERPKDAADVALEILGHVTRPAAQRVEVDVGTGLDQVYPRRPSSVVLGEALPIIGRVRDGVPSKVTVKGVVGGKPFEERISVETNEVDDAGDLRLRWAAGRLQQLLREGAGREAVADLGTRYGLITPYTSYYVPSAEEIARRGPSGHVPRHRPMLAEMHEPSVATKIGHIALGAALMPLTLTGCEGQGETTAAESAPADKAPPPASQPEAAEAEPASDTADKKMAKAKAKRAAAPSEANEAPAPSQRARMAEAASEHSPKAPEEEGAPPSGYGGRGASSGAEADDAEGSNPARRRAGGGSGRGKDDLLGGLGALESTGDSADQKPKGLAERAIRGDAKLGPVQRAAGAGERERSEVMRALQRRMAGFQRCYENELKKDPSLEGRLVGQLRIAQQGNVASADVTTNTTGSSEVASCAESILGRLHFDPEPQSDEVTFRTTFVFTKGGDADTDAEPRAKAAEDDEDSAAQGKPREPAQRAAKHVTVETSWNLDAHRPERCSHASELPLRARRGLWRERLRRESEPAQWWKVYRDAIHDCEAPLWRDRRAMLELMLERASSVEQMLALHGAVSGTAGRFLRQGILEHVRTPEQLRKVKRTFGLSSGKQRELIDQVLEGIEETDARIRAMRRLAERHPDDLRLQRELLDALEQAGRDAEARRLARRMRRSALAGPELRTAIGEMLLRMGDEAEARRAFSEIVEFAPKDALARRRLGDLYRAHGWYEDAYRQYQTLRGLRPDDPSVLLLLAHAAAGAGRVDEALRLERRLAETAAPDAQGGLARIARLWSSVRYAQLRKKAREADDDEKLAALRKRMRRSGVLRSASELRVSLVWPHPDAQLSLWAAHPQLDLTRPADLAPEHGIEVFDVPDAEEGRYRIEVRRGGDDHLTAVEAKLVVVWNEGEQDEKIAIEPVRFEGDRKAFAWTIEGRELTSAEPTVAATGDEKKEAGQ